MNFSTLPHVLHTSKTHLILHDFTVLMYGEDYTLWSSALYSSLLSFSYCFPLFNTHPHPQKNAAGNIVLTVSQSIN
jgi:hypothetical protein